MTDKPQFVGKKVKLGELCEICSGGTPKRSVAEYWKDGTIPWVKIGDMSEKYVSSTEERITDAGFNNSSVKMLEPGTLLYSIFASIGAVSILKIPATTNQAIAGLKIKDDSLDRDFLYHYLKSRESISKSSGRGAAQNNINLTILRNMQVTLPSIEIQRSIVRNLEMISNQVTIAESHLMDLDALVKSRFVDMFGDPIINPKNWQTKRLESMGELKNGVNFKSVDNGYEVKCLSVRDFKDKYSIDDMSQIGTVSLNGRPNASQMLKSGDIVFVRSNGNKALVGRCLAVFPKDEKLTFSGFCIRFRIESNDINLDYFLNCMKSDSMRKAMIGRGANIQNLSQAILSKLSIPIPPLSLQQEFVDFARQVNKSRFGGMLHLLNSLSGIMHASFFSVADTD